MKFSPIVFCLLLLTLTHCKSPSRQIKDAFNTVDKSLEKSNEVLSNSFERLYSAIDSNRQQNEQLASKADSIYFAAAKAMQLMDSLKETMHDQDPSGTSPDVATNLIVSTNTGHKLTHTLLDVYATTSSYPIDGIKKQKLDSVLLFTRGIQDNRQWTKIYFEKAPTIAAITMLKKFENDCASAAFIVLEDIEQRLVRQGKGRNLGKP